MDWQYDIHPMAGKIKMIKRECVYPDSEGGGEVRQHFFGKDGFCFVCGMKSLAPAPGRTNSGYQSGSLEFNPIELNAIQESLVQVWAADERLWTTQETVKFNLRVFARNILKAYYEH